MIRRDLIRWLKSEAHVMPRKKRAAFEKFLDDADPAQQTLPLRRRGKRGG